MEYGEAWMAERIGPNCLPLKTIQIFTMCSTYNTWTTSPAFLASPVFWPQQIAVCSGQLMTVIPGQKCWARESLALQLMRLQTWKRIIIMHLPLSEKFTTEEAASTAHVMQEQHGLKFITHRPMNNALKLLNTIWTHGRCMRWCKAHR